MFETEEVLSLPKSAKNSHMNIFNIILKQIEIFGLGKLVEGINFKLLILIILLFAQMGKLHFNLVNQCNKA